jgi:dynein heavy chain
LRLFQVLDEQILELAASHQVGPLLLLTEALKNGLMSETKSWKLVYGRALNQTCAAEMDTLFEFFGSMQKRLSRPVKDLDDIRALMSAMTEIREAEIRTDLTIIPVEEAYSLLIRHSIAFDDGNAERVDSLSYGWRLVQQKVNLLCHTALSLHLIVSNSYLGNI